MIPSGNNFTNNKMNIPPTPGNQRNFPNHNRIDTTNNININNNNNMSNNNSYLYSNDITMYVQDFVKNSKHPYICCMHIFFKLLSIIIYFLGPYLFKNRKSYENDFILTFAITFFLVSLDFYLVKNITGRFLVKMIWWNDVKEDYSNNFVFYSLDENLLNTTDKNVFWFSLYIFSFHWLIQTIQMLISLQVCWFVLCLLCLILSFCNLFNFWRCSKEQHKVVGNVLNKVNPNALFKKIFNN